MTIREASENGAFDNRKKDMKDNKLEYLTVHVKFHTDIVTCSVTICTTESPGLIMTIVFAIHGLYISIAYFTKRQYLFRHKRDLCESFYNTIVLK